MTQDNEAEKAIPLENLVGCFRIRLESGWGVEFIFKNEERQIVPTVDRAQAERCQIRIEAFIRGMQNGKRSREGREGVGG